MTRKGMKFSTFHLMRWNAWQTQRETYEYQLRFIQYAEELGYYGVWPAEHHFRRYGICPAPLNLCSYIAATTKRIRIGMGVVVVPLYNPIRLAEEIAQLDILSNGRIDLGLGRGYQAVEYEGFRIPMADTRDRFAESLEIMNLAWTTDGFSYKGKYTTIENLNILPKPLQKPRPPIYVAATSPSTMGAMGAQGLPVISAPVQTWEQATQAAKEWREAASAAGHDPEQDLIALRTCHVADSDEEALADLAGLPPVDTDEGSAPIDSAGNWVPGYEFYREVGWKQRTEKQKRDPLKESQVLIGSPKTVIDKIAGQPESGYNHVMLSMDSSGRLPLEKLRKSMELIATRIMPEFRE